MIQIRSNQLKGIIHFTFISTKVMGLLFVASAYFMRHSHYLRLLGITRYAIRLQRLYSMNIKWCVYINRF